MALSGGSARRRITWIGAAACGCREAARIVGPMLRPPNTTSSGMSACRRRIIQVGSSDELMPRLVASGARMALTGQASDRSAVGYLKSEGREMFDRFLGNGVRGRLVGEEVRG